MVEPPVVEPPVDPPPETILQAGSVGVSRLIPDDIVSFSGTFIQFNEDPTEVAANNSVELDSCVLSTDGLEAPSSEFISAGENIVVTSQGNTIATLNRQFLGDTIVYTMENTLTGPVPPALTVDVPGDEFPTFTNISIPEVADLQVTSPALNVPVTPSTQFSWNSNNGQDSTVQITSVFANPPEFRTLTCLVTDDGSFSFPPDFQERMGADFSGTNNTVTRSVNQILTRDSVQFTTASFVTYSNF